VEKLKEEIRREKENEEGGGREDTYRSVRDRNLSWNKSSVWVRSRGESEASMGSREGDTRAPEDLGSAPNSAAHVLFCILRE
jgi:hypothetical protein